MAPETLGMTPSASTTPKEPGQAFLFSAHDSPLRGVVAGVITGTAAVMIGHPFDTVKVRLQSGVKFSPAMFKHIYRGVTAPLSVVMPAWAANFFIYTSVLNRIGTDDISSCTMAGAMTGAIMTLMICPTEFLKCNAQSLTDSAGGKRLTDTQIFRRLVERNGLGSMYTGYAACILRDVGQNGMYFFLAELMNRELKSDGWLGPNLAPFAAGAITGIGHCTVEYPFDCIKTRKQTLQQADSYRKIAATIWNDPELMRNLRSGYFVWMSRAMIVHSLCFGMLDRVMPHIGL